MAQAGDLGGTRRRSQNQVVNTQLMGLSERSLDLGDFFL